MTPDEAKRVLLHSVLDDDGAFVRLRLGDAPGKDRILELQEALKVLRQGTLHLDFVHRDIVYACAAVMHFKEECYFNLQNQPESAAKDLKASIADLAQRAFMVLAGERDT